MAKAENDPMRKSLEELLEERSMAEAGYHLIANPAINEMSVIEDAAHWAPRVQISPEDSYGPLHKVNPTEREVSWLSKVARYADVFAKFHGLTREEYMEMVLGRTGIPKTEESQMNVLVDPKIPIEALLKKGHINPNGVRLGNVEDSVSVPQFPYLIKYSLMKSPREGLPTDDDGFLINKENYAVPQYISPDYAEENMPKGFRGATMREVVFMKMVSSWPYQSTFLAMESRLNGQMLSVSDHSRLGIRLDVVKDTKYDFPGLYAPMVRVARKR